MFYNFVEHFEIVKKRFVDVGKLLFFREILIVADEEIRSEEFG